MSPYPVLGNRPIDQWKVTELKEELKRRKLPLRGLKDDLIRRLDEALCLEMGSTTEDVDNGITSDTEPEAETTDARAVLVGETVKSMDHGESLNELMDANVEEVVINAATNINHGESIDETMDKNAVQTGIDDNAAALPLEKGQDGEVVSDLDSLRAVEESVVNTNSEETINKVTKSVVSEVGLSVKEPQDTEIQSEKSEGGLGVQESRDTEIQNGKSEVGLGVQELRDTNILNEKSEVGIGEVGIGVQESQDMELLNGKSEVVLGVQELKDNNILNEKSEVGLGVQESQDTEIHKGSGSFHAQLENEDTKAQLENKDLEPQVATEDSNPLQDDSMLESSIPNKQVPKVTPILGSQVKSDSIYSDSILINEKNELKDDIIADSVNLEQDNVKPELVQAPSSDVIQDGGDIRPTDVEQPKENKVRVEEPHENKVPIQELDNANADASKKNDSAGLIYSEKLNLDRSSGHDSMEEDTLDGKQIDSTYSSVEVGDGNEKLNVTSMKEDSFVDVVGDDLSAGEKAVHVDGKQSPVARTVKRKLQDQENRGSNEFPKRHRRWNPESVTVPEPKISNVTPSTTIKDTVPTKMLTHNISRSESGISDDAPTERIVPPSQKTPTNSLRIDRFLRPFTLKAVQELLAKTGTFSSFWMDHIKTHCYVTYSSVEEAVETRNAVYNLQWPTNGGRLLIADFVDPQEVKVRVEAPPEPPVNVVPTSVPQHQPQPSPRNQVPKQQLPLPPPPSLPPPPPFQRELPLPPPPPLPEKQDLPILTLDDLFKKTSAMPRIYYLPLSEEQVAAKRATLAQSSIRP